MAPPLGTELAQFRYNFDDVLDWNLRGIVSLRNAIAERAMRDYENLCREYGVKPCVVEVEVVSYRHVVVATVVRA